MDFQGSYLLLADRQAVWGALNDTRVLSEVIPGCQNIDWTGPTSLDLEIKINLGLISPKLGGELELSEIDPAVSYLLSGRGRGKFLEHAHGSARISLRDIDVLNPPAGINGEDLDEFLYRNRLYSGPATGLHFKARGGASGKIMDMGKALVGKSAQRIIDGFFVRFAGEMDVQLCPLSLGENEMSLGENEISPSETPRQNHS